MAPWRRLPSRTSPHDREIWRLALPAFGALTAEPLYVLVDTAIVGQLGTSQLAGVAVAAAVLVAGFAIFNFLAVLVFVTLWRTPTLGIDVQCDLDNLVGSEEAIVDASS